MAKINLKWKFQALFFMNKKIYILIIILIVQLMIKKILIKKIKKHIF